MPAYKAVVKIPPKAPRKQKGPRFTKVSYAIIGVLLREPFASFAGNDKTAADRMIKHGWLEVKDADVPTQAGAYQYVIKKQVYSPTEAGKKLYERYNSIIQNHSLDELEFAVGGAKAEESLLGRVKRKEKLIKKALAF